MRLKIFGQEPPDTKQCTKIYIFCGMLSQRYWRYVEYAKDTKDTS